MMRSALNKKKQLLQGKAANRSIPKIPNPNKITDYRPISLLFNTDYELIALVFDFCLRKTLQASLGSHQKGGVPDRFIFDSLCIIQDVMNNIVHKLKQGSSLKRAAIIAYYLKKDYDLVNRYISWKVMTAMGYPLTFIDWLKTLYSVTQLCPLNGTDIVSTVDVAQSVWQGCSLLVLLFALYIEPLLVVLTQCINGIEHYGKCKKG